MDSQLRRYYLSAGGILLLAVAVSLWWRSPAVTFGVGAGVLVGVLPFATWHLLIGMLASGKPGRKVKLMGLVAVKYALAAVALWALFASGTAEPMAVAAGVVAGSLAIFPVAFMGPRG